MEDRLVALGEVHPSIKAYAGELQAARKPYQPQSLFDVARAFSRRVPLGRLVEIEPAVRPYLASLLVEASGQGRQSSACPNEFEAGAGHSGGF